MKQDMMREKPVLPLVVSMALPMTISMLVNSLYNIVDSFYVAKISEDAMTALSLVFPAQNLVNAVAIGFGIGINAVISYYSGKREKEMANTAATIGMALSVIHSILLGIACIGGMRWFLMQFTKSFEIIHLGNQYARIVFLFCIPHGLGIGFEKIFQAVGRMKAAMFSMLVGCIVNIVLDPIFIFGAGILPKMGIAGAALATGIGQATAFVIYLGMYLLYRKQMEVRICFKSLKGTKLLVTKIYGIGIPAILSLALPSAMITVLNGLLSEYSAAHVLVLGAYYKLQTFIYLTANGIVQGLRPICGYNLGAGEFKRVRDIYKTGLALISGIMLIGTLLSMAIPAQLIGLFTDNGETISLGVEALRIISIGFIPSGISVTVAGVMEGLGRGKESLGISLVRYLVAILPLSVLLCQFLGAAGVWCAFAVTEIIAAAVSFLLLHLCFKKIFSE